VKLVRGATAQPSGEAQVAEFGAGSRAGEVQQLSGVVMEVFVQEAAADAVGLGAEELAGILLEVGAKCNFGLAAGAAAGHDRVCAFWRSLQLRDLALARACALGRDAAWQQFMARFREPLTQAAIGITGSAAQGSELADSLYGELFGVSERGEQRRSPLSYYAGRGSLLGFLRATLAQRHIDHHRRTSREAPLTQEDYPAAAMSPAPEPQVLARLSAAVTAALNSLPAEERFILAAWFLDGRTLLEISGLLRVHEATVSRRLHRLTERLHKELLKQLQAGGLSRAAAEESLGADPRDINVNLRKLLQGSPPPAFQE
jgi:RNA polymerase sigma-70 factor (ECF subfamily)